MSTIPANSSGTCSFGNGSNNLNAKNTPSSDANGTGGAMSRASISSMMVQDFMAYLANEPNIANMTVETNDGRRISATFEHGTVETVAPSNSLNMSKTTCNGVSKNISWNGSLDEKNDKANGNSKNDELMSQTSQTRDVAATMAMMGEEKLASASKMQAPTSEGYDSQQWAINYSNKHVAITYSNIGAAEISSIPIENVPKTSGSSTLPPKKRAAKQEEGTSETSWNPMAALADAATVLREHAGGPQVISTIAGTQVASAIAMGATVATEALKKKPPRRKSRKIIPEVKVYVEFTQKDVLFGRGGRSNHHPGNKIYRDIVTKEQKHYRGCDKNEKTKVAQCIVDHIQGVVGGRFLEMDKDAKRWFLVPNVVARRKVGQALRENNTEEARAAKRAKYQGKLNNKKKDLATIDFENDAVPAAAVNSANAGNSTLPLVPANSANTTIASIPVVGVSGSTNNVVYPIAAVTGVTANNFPVDDPESSNQVEV